MNDYRITEHTKLTGGADFAALAASRETSQVVLWDLGPRKPEAPDRPEVPQGKEGTPAYDLAMVEFKQALEGYDVALRLFKRQKDEYADFERRYGGPYEVTMWSCDAQDALARDKTRYCISSRTRGHERKANGGLPKGMTPGHGQAENMRREAEGETDLANLRRQDPVFGPTEALAS